MKEVDSSLPHSVRVQIYATTGMVICEDIGEVTVLS